MVVEAATEKEEVKTGIYRTLTPHLKAILHDRLQHVVDLDHAAGRQHRPAEKFIGMHFMNPVPVMKLVEVIRGIATDEPTFQADPGARARLNKTTCGQRGLPRLHRQPHPGADDQRGGVRAV